MTRINVAIAVAGEAHGRLYEVAAICRGLGFGHTATLSDVGVLRGSVELEALAALRAVPGVLGVEEPGALQSLGDEAAERGQ